MTNQQAATLTPGTPVFIAEFTVYDEQPSWRVSPGKFSHIYEEPWEETPCVALIEDDDDNDWSYGLPIANIHRDRLDALQWIAGRLAEHRRKSEVAFDRLHGEILAAAVGDIGIPE